MRKKFLDSIRNGYMNPNYYAIIPAEVRYSDIPANAKLLYGEITALSSKEGYCWASNDYFGKLYGVNGATVSQWIKQLKAHGFISCELTNNTDRRIFIQLSTPHKKMKGGIEKGEGYPHEKGEGSITRVSTTTKGADEPRVVFVEDEDKPTKKDTRSKEKSEVFSLFSSRSEPWMHHTTQKAAALRLYDRGLDKLKRGLEIMRDREYDFCPEAHTPWEYEQKLPKLRAYMRKNNI